MKNKGFTLIELMIVVVIIGIIAAIAIPAFLGFREKSSTKADYKKQIMTDKQIISKKNVKEFKAVGSIIPETKSADVKIKLVVSDYIRNFKVYTLFDVEFTAEYIFINSNKNNKIQLFFPFPQGTTHARDVLFEIYDLASKEFIEPDNVIYELNGIKWFGNLSKGSELKTKVKYNTQGNEQYIYKGPGANRAGALKIEMKLEGGTSELIPPKALQPNIIKPGHLVWDFKNLITDQKIIVKLPGAMSNTGRVILFLRLAGLAVFLFGIGFMYLNDLTQPGRLDNFRWGHFLLLAITYCLFFIIFTILNLSGNMNTFPALIVATFLSLPLLMIHVSRFWGVYFSFTQILPLAVFTLGIVINGVYGSHYRSYIFIGFMVCAAAFFTLTYQTWLEKRKAYDQKKQNIAQEKLEKEKQKQEEQRKEKARIAWRTSREKKAEKILDDIARLVKEIESLESETKFFLEFEDIEEHFNIRNFIKQRNSHLSDMKNWYNNLKLKIKNIKTIQEDTQFSDIVSQLETDARKFKIQFKQSKELLEKAVKDLTQMRERQKANEFKAKDMHHCISCGFESFLSKHCPNCGVLSPVKLTCEKCGKVYMLPIHMIDINKAKNLHCNSCGHKHNYKVSNLNLF